MWRGGSGPIIEDGLANWKKKLVILTTIDGLISRKGTRFISLITGLQSHFQNTNVQINKSQQFAQLFALVPILGWESRFFFTSFWQMVESASWSHSRGFRWWWCLWMNETAHDGVHTNTSVRFHYALSAVRTWSV